MLSLIFLSEYIRKTVVVKDIKGSDIFAKINGGFVVFLIPINAEVKENISMIIVPVHIIIYKILMFLSGSLFSILSFRLCDKNKYFIVSHQFAILNEDRLTAKSMWHHV